jgi:hypothetical protein
LTMLFSAATISSSCEVPVAAWLFVSKNLFC